MIAMCTDDRDRYQRNEYFALVLAVKLEGEERGMAKQCKIDGVMGLSGIAAGVRVCQTLASGESDSPVERIDHQKC